MTKRFLVVISFACLLGFASAVIAQQTAALAPNKPNAYQQEIGAIQQLGGFLQNVTSLQSQGFLDVPTANTLQSSTWSMIDTLASLSIAVDCHSVTDLISEVNASGLKPVMARPLVNLLNQVQGNINRAQAALKQGNNAGALQYQLLAIQELASFIGLVNSDRQWGLIGAPTANALEACALNLVSATHAIPSVGLVASFAFNGNANDSSGGANNGTVVGASFQTYGAGTKMALLFQGNTSSYVVIPQSASLEPTNALTISMWVNGVPGEACGYGWGTILRKANNCAPGYFIRGCNGGTGFWLSGPDACGSSSANVSVWFPPFTGTSWQHIVGTYSVADGVVKTYENGVLINQAPWTNPLTHSGDLYIGGAAVAGDDGGFQGLINDVQIYNRALSAAEVQQLYLSDPHP